MPASLCRVCLADNLRMYDIENIHLRQLYEKLAGAKLETGAERPAALCYACFGQLRRCAQFAAAARAAQRLLAAGSEISPETVAALRPGTLSLSTTCSQHLSVDLEDDTPCTQPDGRSPADNVRVYVWEHDVSVKREPLDMKADSSTEEIFIEIERIADGESTTEQNTEVDLITKYNLNDYVNRTISNLYNEAIGGYNPGEDNSTVSVHSDAEPGCEERPPHACSSCGKRFSLKRYLKSHMLVHSGEKKFSCSAPECGKTFARKSDLNRHRKSHADERAAPPAEHRCEVCGRAFGSRTGVGSHMRAHGGARPHRCALCGADFRFEANLRAHERGHAGERAVSCAQCGKRFAARGNLAQHLRTHGAPPAPARPRPAAHACPQCARRFSCAAYLTRHLRRHSGERPFACARCDKRYADSGSLHLHRRVHSGERPYACEACGRAFARSHQLKQHRAAAECGPRAATARELHGARVVDIGLSEPKLTRV